MNARYPHARPILQTRLPLLFNLQIRSVPLLPRRIQFRFEFILDIPACTGDLELENTFVLRLVSFVFPT